MDTIINFFKNKWVKLVAWTVLALSAVALIVGGATVESISGGVALVSGIISAVSALVAFIASQVKK